MVVELYLNRNSISEEYKVRYVYNAVLEYLYFISVRGRRSYTLIDLEKYVKLFKAEVCDFVSTFHGDNTAEKLRNMISLTTNLRLFQKSAFFPSLGHNCNEECIVEELILSKTADLVTRDITNTKKLFHSIRLNHAIQVSYETFVDILRNSTYFDVKDEAIQLKSNDGLFGFDGSIFMNTIKYFQSYIQSAHVFHYNEIFLHQDFIEYNHIRHILVIFCILDQCELFKCESSSVTLDTKDSVDTAISKPFVVDIKKLQESLITIPTELLIYNVYGSMLHKWRGEIGKLMDSYGFIYCIVGRRETPFSIYFNRTALKYLFEVENLKDVLNVRDKVEFDAVFPYNLEIAMKHNVFWKATSVKVVRQPFRKSFPNVVLFPSAKTDELQTSTGEIFIIQEKHSPIKSSKRKKETVSGETKRPKLGYSDPTYKRQSTFETDFSAFNKNHELGTYFWDSEFNMSSDAKDYIHSIETETGSEIIQHTTDNGHEASCTTHEEASIGNHIDMTDDQKLSVEVNDNQPVQVIATDFKKLQRMSISTLSPIMEEEEIGSDLIEELCGDTQNDDESQKLVKNHLDSHYLFNSLPNSLEKTASENTQLLEHSDDKDTPVENNLLNLQDTEALGEMQNNSHDLKYCTGAHDEDMSIENTHSIELERSEMYEKNKDDSVFNLDNDGHDEHMPIDKSYFLELNHCEAYEKNQDSQALQWSNDAHDENMPTENTHSIVLDHPEVYEENQNLQELDKNCPTETTHVLELDDGHEENHGDSSLKSNNNAHAYMPIEDVSSIKLGDAEEYNKTQGEQELKLSNGIHFDNMPSENSSVQIFKAVEEHQNIPQDLKSTGDTCDEDVPIENGHSLKVEDSEVCEANQDNSQDSKLNNSYENVYANSSEELDACEKSQNDLHGLIPNEENSSGSSGSSVSLSETEELSLISIEDFLPARLRTNQLYINGNLFLKVIFIIASIVIWNIRESVAIGYHDGRTYTIVFSNSAIYGDKRKLKVGGKVLLAVYHNHDTVPLFSHFVLLIDKKDLANDGTLLMGTSEFIKSHIQGEIGRFPLCACNNGLLSSLCDDPMPLIDTEHLENITGALKEFFSTCVVQSGEQNLLQAIRKTFLCNDTSKVINCVHLLVSSVILNSRNVRQSKNEYKSFRFDTDSKPSFDGCEFKTMTTEEESLSDLHIIGKKSSSTSYETGESNFNSDEDSNEVFLSLESSPDSENQPPVVDTRDKLKSSANSEQHKIPQSSHHSRSPDSFRLTRGKVTKHKLGLNSKFKRSTFPQNQCLCCHNCGVSVIHTTASISGITDTDLLLDVKVDDKHFTASFDPAYIPTEVKQNLQISSCVNVSVLPCPILQLSQVISLSIPE